MHDRPFTGWSVPVVKTTASTKTGIAELALLIHNHSEQAPENIHKKELLFNRAVRLAQNHLFKKVDLQKFRTSFENAGREPGFNIYRFISGWFS